MQRTYSTVPNRRVGWNKQVGWNFSRDLINKVGGMIELVGNSKKFIRFFHYKG